MSASIKTTVKKTRPVTVAFIRVKGSFTQIPACFGKLYGWIMEKGYKPSGPAMAVYYTVPGQVPDDQLVWELRSQISGKVADSGPDEQGLGVKRLESIQVVTAMHKGPYESIEPTYNALMEWVAKNGYEIDGPFEELYFNDPSNTPAEEALTEIRFPVKKK